MSGFGEMGEMIYYDIHETNLGLVEDDYGIISSHWEYLKTSLDDWGILQNDLHMSQDSPYSPVEDASFGPFFAEPHCIMCLRETSFLPGNL